MAVPGVSVSSFLRSSLAGLKREVTPAEFVGSLKSRMGELKIDESFASRGVNDGFSGGEKKKSEVLQLSILKPKYAILDETDSGLDVDALKIVAKEIKKVAGPKVGILLITHYQRILRYIKPDYVHVMMDGEVVKSGNYKLAELVEEKGYAEISNVKIDR